MPGAYSDAVRGQCVRENSGLLPHACTPSNLYQYSYRTCETFILRIMQLNESNLALLQDQASRSASPEMPLDKQIAEIERECNALARRLERQGRTDCLARQLLAFTNGRLYQADGAAIRTQMATWQRIERCLAAEFPPLIPGSS